MMLHVSQLVLHHQLQLLLDKGDSDMHTAGCTLLVQYGLFTRQKLKSISDEQVNFFLLLGDNQ